MEMAKTAWNFYWCIERFTDGFNLFNLTLTRCILKLQTKKTGHFTVDDAFIHLPYCESTAVSNIFVYNCNCCRVRETSEKKLSHSLLTLDKVLRLFWARHLHALWLEFNKRFELVRFSIDYGLLSTLKRTQPALLGHFDINDVILSVLSFETYH